MKASYLDEVVIGNMSKRGHKSIALAYKDMSPEEFNDILVEKMSEGMDAMCEAVEVDLILLGVLGIEDPIREEVKGLLT